MLIAIENIIDEAVDDGRLADSLIAQKHNFVLEEGRDRALREVQVARICHFKYRILIPII